MAARSKVVRLPPEVNRILFVRNLPYKITSEEMYDIFGKYGAIRQIRVGATAETKGTAFVVYEDIYDAKNACEHLSGFNVGGRFLVVLYFQVNKINSRFGIDKQKAEVEALRARVSAGEAAARAATSSSIDSIDDESDRKLMRR